MHDLHGWGIHVQVRLNERAVATLYLYPVFFLRNCSHSSGGMKTPKRNLRFTVMRRTFHD